MKTYEIYKHTAPNGKVYIGQTCNRKRRDYVHKTNKKITPFTEAIAEFGWSAFQHETLAHGLTKEQADELEVSLITTLGTLYPGGLNLHPGGALPKVSDIQRNEAYLRDRPIHTRCRAKTKPEPEIKFKSIPITEEEAKTRKNKIMSLPSDERVVISGKCNVGGPRGYRRYY